MIIGITGKAGAGKSTLGNFIRKHMRELSAFQHVVKIGFADDVKSIAANQFRWNGQKDDKGRRLLQVIGTEAGRAYNENIWVEKLAEYDAPHVCVIADDVRFNNEAIMCKQRGKLILVEGRADDLGENSSHASEKGIDIPPDFRIVNDGDLVALESQAAEIVRTILEG